MTSEIVLTRLSQKARVPVDRFSSPISQTPQSPANRQSLPHPVTPMKQGKPVCLPLGKRAVRLADGHAGKGNPRKPMPDCNGRDSGALPRRENVLTSDRFFHHEDV